MSDFERDNGCCSIRNPTIESSKLKLSNSKRRNYPFVMTGMAAGSKCKMVYEDTDLGGSLNVEHRMKNDELGEGSGSKVGE